MTFLVLLLALLIERFFDWSHLRSWNWYYFYQRKILQIFGEHAPFIVLAVTILPLLLLVWLIEFLLGGWLYGAIKFIFTLFMIIYCFGPKNLWVDIFAGMNALSQPNASIASDKLNLLFGFDDTDSPQTVRRQFFDHIFIEANRRIFAIIFWFLVLGPVGAVLYRTVSLSETDLKDAEISKKATIFEAMLSWIPVRIFTFLLGLGGHFAKVFPFWSKKALLGIESNDILLSGCGAASILNSNEVEIPEDGIVLKNALSLLDRTFVIALVMILFMGFIF